MDPESLSAPKRFIKTYQHYINAGIDLTAGSIGGAACVFVGQPLDTIKEGFRGLYAGTVPALAANIAENSVLFCAYGVCQNVLLCPTELIKCRLQAMRETSCNDVHNRTNIGPWSLTKEIFRTEGIRGFFRGFGVTVLREMPGYFFSSVDMNYLEIFLTPAGKSKDEIGFRRCIRFGSNCSQRTFPASGALFVAQDQIGLVDSALGFWIRVDGFKTLLVMHRQKSVAGIRGMD
ncbi:mitochondrial ornithine transporter 1 [Caerostris extrusa]|uniref:Mitochondrial ornithine transporter 1 n=1 Tax=Caerostris extrusa TaxID=172846 RepID=A0AAV4SC87_CAEEX|nr:mitochondrial ornithine transporter 1 [Caerostris extrusa]